jgi:hypothetical protein
VRSSVRPSVTPSVPSSTGPGANPAYTTSAPAARPGPGPAVTGEAAGGAKPVPQPSGKPPAWLKTFATALGWKPQNPPVRPGVPEALPPGQNANWVQHAISRGTVGSDAPRGRARDTFAPHSADWTRTQQFTPNDIQSQDVNPEGWINLHPNDRMDFFTLRGADDPANVTYWPPDTSQNPDMTPLAVIPGATTPYPSSDYGAGAYAVNNGEPAAQWIPAGVNSAYTAPSPPQATASPVASYQPDPAQEWL